MWIRNTLFSFFLITLLIPLTAQDIHRIETDLPVVCLTFDDGPTEKNTHRLLHILGEYDAKATFFVIGEKVPLNEEILQEVHAAGHEIGNHSFTHRNLAELESQADVSEDIEHCQRIVMAATGSKPEVFRAPYLSQNETVSGVLENAGLPSIFCSASTRDWDSASTKESILNRAIEGLKPGAIILMHEFSNNTVDILPSLLEEIKEQGYRAATISQAISMTSQQ